MNGRARHATHTRVCHQCGRRRPKLGFRGAVCGECCVADLLRFPAGRLAVALHYATGQLTCREWDAISEILHGQGEA